MNVHMRNNKNAMNKDKKSTLNEAHMTRMSQKHVLQFFEALNFQKCLILSFKKVKSNFDENGELCRKMKK